jgi:CBS domain-containing protein
MKRTLVEAVMTSIVHSCRVGEPISRAARIMWDFAVGCVTVVNDDGEVVAVVTDRDVCMAAYTQGKPLHEIPIATAASARLIVLSPTDSLETAEQLMADFRIRRLPVVDEKGRPVGIVSIDDIARYAASRRGREDHRLVRTMAAVAAYPIPPSAAAV